MKKKIVTRKTYAAGNSSGYDDEATINIENQYRQSRNPALPERTGPDHRIDAGTVTAEPDLITTPPAEISNTISPRPLQPLPTKPEEP
jgi:hypothetical protein